MDGGLVAAAAPIHVVGRGPHSDELSVKHELVALHDELVGAADEVKLVLMVELGGPAGEGEAGRRSGGNPPQRGRGTHLLHHIPAKQVAGAARVEAPTVHLCSGIRRG